MAQGDGGGQLEAVAWAQGLYCRCEGLEISFCLDFTVKPPGSEGTCVPVS